MNKIKLTVLFLLAFLIAGCQSAKDNRSVTATTSQAIDPVVLYENAANDIRSKDSLSYYIGTTKTTTIAGQAFTVEAQQQLNIQDFGKETVRSSMTEHLQVGTFSAEISEYYENGNGYVIVDGSAFTAPLSPDRLNSRHPLQCNTDRSYRFPERNSPWHSMSFHGTIRHSHRLHR